MTLESKPLFTIEADVALPISVGSSEIGERRYIPIVGGRFSGLCNGKVLPGADWQTVLASGAIELKAHYALETDDGARIEVLSQGVRTAPPEIMQRLARGEIVDPSQYYFRTAIRLRTGAPSLARLNFILAVAVAERRPANVRLLVHEIL